MFFHGLSARAAGTPGSVEIGAAGRRWSVPDTLKCGIAFPRLP